jgi:membrane protein YdbS with pleckstrin-like domain
MATSAKPSRSAPSRDRADASSGGAGMTLYRLARAFILACGLLVLFLTIASQFMMTELYYDRGPAPPWPDRAPAVAGTLAYALLLVLPYRWSVDGWSYRIRLTLLLAGSLWLVVAIAIAVRDVLLGRKHWVAIPASLFVLALAVLAPVALILRRRSFGPGRSG